jgi:GH3 auxin-responsive promoter
MSGWAAILAAARAESARFARACAQPRTAQLALLREILEQNAESAFGRAHRFERIETIEAFRAQVPIRDYEGHRRWIERR